MSALNDRTVGYTNIPSTYNNQQYNLDTSSSKLAVREILQPTERFDPITGRSLQYGQNNLRSMQANPSRGSGGTTYTAWHDMVRDQADTANRDLINQKMEDKIRKQRYREYLDKLSHEQKQSRLSEQADHLNSYPNRDWNTFKDFEAALQNNQQTQKREIKDSLDENFRMHMEKKNKIKMEKEAMDAEMLKRYEEAKKFDEFARSIERERKNGLMADLKTDVQRYTQNIADQEQKRQLSDQEYNQKATELITNKEKDAKQFYEKIRQQSLEKNVRGLENLQPFVNEARQRDAQLHSLIEQSRQEKLRIDEDEQRARLERQRHLHVSSQMDNGQIMKMKMMEDQLKKRDTDLKFQDMKRRIEETQKLEMMKKMGEHENRKNYQSILDHQVQERVHNKRHETELNRIEQQFLARKDPENAFIAVPNGKHSHERQLQLKYIDKWLVRNPEVPAEDHQRLRYRKDPVEQMNNYGGQDINPYSRRPNPII